MPNNLQAQVLSDGAAQKKLGKVIHKKEVDVPVMFFGTLEIAWLASVDVVGFREGIAKGFLNKAKHKSFQKAVAQVRCCAISMLRCCNVCHVFLLFSEFPGQVMDFLALGKKRRSPQYWWCKPPSNGEGVGAIWSNGVILCHTVMPSGLGRRWPSWGMQHAH
jgi:hypothetical protein